MTNIRLRHLWVLLGATSAVAAPFACETGSATFAVIDDSYPSPANDGGTGAQNVVYRGWWTVTYFSTPVAAGAESPANRVIPAMDYAYVVLAPGWDPASGVPPKTLLPMRTKNPVSVARGDTLHITVSDETANGNCAAGQPLTQDEADLITQSIFPDEFAGVTYDAATCTTTPIADGGSSSTDAGVGDAGAGVIDSGTADATGDDADASALDSGVADGGNTDSGIMDAGNATDAADTGAE